MGSISKCQGEEQADASRYLCVELDVGTRGVHDDLLGDGALLADPQGAADDASELAGGGHVRRPQHVLHRLPARPGSVRGSAALLATGVWRQAPSTWSAGDNPSHPKHPSTAGRRQTRQTGCRGNRLGWPL